MVLGWILVKILYTRGGMFAIKWIFPELPIRNGRDTLEKFRWSRLLHLTISSQFEFDNSSWPQYLASICIW